MKTKEIKLNGYILPNNVKDNMEGLEQIFGELEEGKIILSPSIREHFEMECCNDKNY